MTALPGPVARYFDAIRARDADALEQLFTDDAALVTAAGTFTGPAAIARFYRELAFTVEDLSPDPGPPVIDGDRCAVEIRLRMNGTVMPAGDFFTLAGDRIRRLVIYTLPPA